MAGVANVEPAQRPSRPLWANENELNDREYAFVREYLVDLNGTQAIIRAGLSEEGKEKAAGVEAHRIFHRPHVQRAIDAAMHTDGSGPRQWLINKLMRIARGDLSDFIDYVDVTDPRDGKVKYRRAVVKELHTLPPEVRGLVKKLKVNQASGEVTVELHDPLRAMELLGKATPIGLTRDTAIIATSDTLEALVLKAAGKRIEAQQQAKTIDVTPKEIPE